MRLRFGIKQHNYYKVVIKYCERATQKSIILEFGMEVNIFCL